MGIEVHPFIVNVLVRWSSLGLGDRSKERLVLFVSKSQGTFARVGPSGECSGRLALCTHKFPHAAELITMTSFCPLPVLTFVGKNNMNCRALYQNGSKVEHRCLARYSAFQCSRGTCCKTQFSILKIVSATFGSCL